MNKFTLVERQAWLGRDSVARAWIAALAATLLSGLPAQTAASSAGFRIEVRVAPPEAVNRIACSTASSAPMALEKSGTLAQPAPAPITAEKVVTNSAVNIDTVARVICYQGNYRLRSDGAIQSEIDDRDEAASIGYVGAISTVLRLVNAGKEQYIEMMVGW